MRDSYSRRSFISGAGAAVITLAVTLKGFSGKDGNGTVDLTLKQPDSPVTIQEDVEASVVQKKVLVTFTLKNTADNPVDGPIIDVRLVNQGTEVDSVRYDIGTIGAGNTLQKSANMNAQTLENVTRIEIEARNM